MRRIHAPSITQPVSPTNFDAPIEHNAFRKFGSAMEHRIVRTNRTNHPLANSPLAKLAISNAKIDDVCRTNSTAIITMIAATIRTRRIVATINVPRKCGLVPILGIAFHNGNYAMEAMIARMAQTRRHVPAIYVPLWGANPGAGHRRAVAFALVHRATNWMSDSKGFVQISMNALNLAIAIRLAKIIGQVSRVDALAHVFAFKWSKV